MSTESNDYVYDYQIINLWNHFENPGVCISREKNVEIYATKLCYVESIDVRKGSFAGYFTGYSLDRQATLLNVPTISLPYLIEKIPLHLFEKKYPGFTKRAKTALDVGLSAEDVAAFAVGESSPFEKNEKKSAGLPDLS